MLNQLFDLLDRLIEKESSVTSVLELLGGEEDQGFLQNELMIVEKMIVRKLGGDDEHHQYISEAMFFTDYTNQRISRNELIEQVKHSIENDFKGEIPIIIKSF
ncbi:hypothetical protein ACQJ18_26810 [Priestia megaterium]|uniref:hypothetical protein n=1 Tax=Priestia megaterium TaxID=1404 RepID=UPI003D065B3F